MRLVCPNCGAQYEVDSRVIPEGGRDVQCSNCGHTWFQKPVGAEALEGLSAASESDPAEEARAEAPAGPGEGAPESGAVSQAAPGGEAPAEVSAPRPEPVSEPESAPEQGAGQAPVPPADAGQQDPASGETPAEDMSPERPRRVLDESLREVLREEAEREARARAREKIETQEDLGLHEPSAPGQRPIDSRERMARLRGLDREEEAPASAPASGDAGARRDLLPDIEEINSSLTSIGAEEIVDDFAEPMRQSGFARGFAVMLLLAVLAVALYLYAPLIGGRIPAMAGPLEAYMGVVDAARGWLDEMVKQALAELQ